MTRNTERRRLLQLLGAPAVLSLAGCSRLGGMNADDSEVAGDTAHPGDNGLVTVTSDESVDETVSRITSAIEESPLTLMTTVDHAENAASVDEDLPPTRLLLFGNPDVGTPLIQSSRTIGLDLPQRMLVWKEDDEVYVTYNDPEYLAERHDIDGQSDRLKEISGVLENLAMGDESGD